MMATDDDTEIRPDVRMLPRLIEAAEVRGDWSHAQKLRDWLEEAEASRAATAPAQAPGASSPRNANKMIWPNAI